MTRGAGSLMKKLTRSSWRFSRVGSAPGVHPIDAPAPVFNIVVGGSVPLQNLTKNEELSGADRSGAHPQARLLRGQPCEAGVVRVTASDQMQLVGDHGAHRPQVRIGLLVGLVSAFSSEAEKGAIGEADVGLP